MKQLFTLRQACFMGFKRVNKPNQKTILTLLLMVIAKVCLATAPVITDLNKSGQPCETAIKFVLTDFSSSFTDADGDAIGKVKIISLPSTTQGTLKLFTINVSVGQEIDAAYLGDLSFNVTAGFTGTSTFAFNIADAGGTYAITSKNINVTVPPASSITNNVVATTGQTGSCQTYFDPAPITESSAPIIAGGLSYTYQWEQSTDDVTFTKINGATAKDYDPAGIYYTTYYRRKVISGFCSNTSPEVAITMYAQLSNIGIHSPTSSTGCGSNTDPGVISGDAPSGGNGTYSYEWESSPGTDPSKAVWTKIPGAVGKDYDPAGISASTLFRRKTISGQCSDYSSPILVNTAASSVTNNSFVLPPVNAVCGGTSLDPGQIMGTVPGGSTNYQWQQSYSNNGPWTDISGETGRDYNPPLLTQTTFYRRAVYAGCYDYSLPQAIIIAPNAISNNTIGANQFILTGQTPDPITGSQPSGGDGSNYTYRWEQSTDGNTWSGAAGSANGRDYQPPALTNSMYYRRNVSCGLCTSLSSQTIITVGTVTISNNTISPNGIIESCGVPNIDPPLLTGAVASSNISFTYQWQQSLDGTSWQNIVDAVSKDYNPSSITKTTSYHRLVIAAGKTDAGNSVTFTVNSLGIGTNNVSADQTILINATPSLLLGSDPTTAAGQVPQYSWEKSSDGVNNWIKADGANNTKNYQPPALATTTYYRRKVNLGVCTESISNKVKITVSAIVPISNNIIDPPSNISNLCGVASIDPFPIPGRLPTASISFTYQWEQSPNGTTWSTIPGATDQNYDPGMLTQSTYFQRKVITASETSTSNKLAILISPVVLSSNTITTNQDINYGTAPFPLAGSLPAGGDGNYAYTWEQSANGKDNWTTAPDINTTRNYQPPTLTSSLFYRRTVTSGACKSVSDSVRIKVTAIVDLNLTKTGKLSESIDNGIDYTLKVLNKGPQDADSVIVRDTLAANVKYYSASSDKGTFSYNETTRVLTWIIGQLKNSETTELKLVVEAFASESITNRAVVTSRTIDLDPDYSNNQSTSVFPFVLFVINANTLPNMITPNGDGKNDILKFPQMDAFTDNELHVFDRWGNTVYTIKGYQNNWNGTGLSEGTYFYVLKVRVGGKIRQFKEYLTIVRNRFNG